VEVRRQRPVPKKKGLPRKTKTVATSPTVWRSNSLPRDCRNEDIMEDVQESPLGHKGKKKSGVFRKQAGPLS